MTRKGKRQAKSAKPAAKDFLKRDHRNIQQTIDVMDESLAQNKRELAMLKSGKRPPKTPASVVERVREALSTPVMSNKNPRDVVNTGVVADTGSVTWRIERDKAWAILNDKMLNATDALGKAFGLKGKLPTWDMLDLTTRNNFTYMGREVWDELADSTPEGQRAFLVATENLEIQSYRDMPALPRSTRNDVLVREWNRPDVQTFKAEYDGSNRADGWIMRLRFPKHPNPVNIGKGDWVYLCAECMSFHPKTHKHAADTHKRLERKLKQVEHERLTAVHESGNMYSRALECQLRVMNTMDRFDRDKYQEESAVRITAALTTAICEVATPYYFTHDTFRLINGTYRAIPDWTMTREVLPTKAGFMYFPTTFDLWGDRMNGSRIHAIAWIDIQLLIDDLFKRDPSFKNENPDAHYRKPGVTFVALGEVPGGHLVPVGCLHWAFGSHLHDMRTNTGPMGYEDTQELGEVTQEDRLVIGPAFGGFIAAALSFVNQKLMVFSKALPERHTRRRLMAAGVKEPPIIRVVHLRKKVYMNRDQDHEHEARDWQFRWAVSGHWRNQFYPSTNTHAPRWISSYVKGPDSKPLKVPGNTIFAVTE